MKLVTFESWCHRCEAQELKLGEALPPTLKLLGGRGGALPRARWLEPKRAKPATTRGALHSQKTRLGNWSTLRLDPPGASLLSGASASSEQRPESWRRLRGAGSGGAADRSTPKERLSFNCFAGKETKSGKHGRQRARERAQLRGAAQLGGGLAGLGSEAKRAPDTRGPKSTRNGLNSKGLNLDGSGLLVGSKGAKGGGGPSQRGEQPAAAAASLALASWREASKRC